MRKLPSGFDALVANVTLWALIGLLFWLVLSPVFGADLKIPKKGTAHYWYICARTACEKPKPKPKDEPGYDNGLRYDEPTSKSHKK